MRLVSATGAHRAACRDGVGVRADLCRNLLRAQLSGISNQLSEIRLCHNRRPFGPCGNCLDLREFLVYWTVMKSEIKLMLKRILFTGDRLLSRQDEVIVESDEVLNEAQVSRVLDDLNFF